MSSVEKIVVIGSGPAGWTACIYAGRDLLSPLIISGEPHTIGGQLMLTTDIENYPGFAEPVLARDLMSAMRRQAERCGTRILEERAIKVDLSQRPFVITTSGGKTIQTHTIVAATGAAAKWLGLLSEAHFQGAGVSGCAVCDGFLFRNKIVGVVGGGNTATEEALYLTKFAKQVYMFVRKDNLTGEKITAKEAMEHPQIKIMWNTDVEEVLGVDTPEDKYVTGVRFKDGTTIDLDGLFVAIGHAPSTELFVGQLEMEHGYIITKPGTTQTSIEGVYAAGDVQDPIYRQAVTSAGTGCMAALEITSYLAKMKLSK